MMNLLHITIKIVKYQLYNKAIVLPVFKKSYYFIKIFVYVKSYIIFDL